MIAGGAEGRARGRMADAVGLVIEESFPVGSLGNNQLEYNNYLEGNPIQRVLQAAVWRS